MTEQTRIAIAGPPFSGKSLVGSILAEKLGLEFVDLDRLIERRSGSTVPKIFASVGESGFRARELRALKEVLELCDVVVSLGGGALLSSTSLRQVLTRCTLFTLWARADELVRRSSRGGRPLAPNTESLLQLLKNRRKHYLSLPNRIDTEGVTPEKVADRILSMIGRREDRR